MKLMSVLMCVLLLGLNAKAGVQFKDNSDVPVEMQNVILQKFYELCGHNTFSSQVLVAEESTKVTVHRIDQGVIDFYYSTFFTVRDLFDGVHPVSYSIVVNSADFSGNNPKVQEVQSVQSDFYDCTSWNQ